MFLFNPSLILPQSVMFLLYCFELQSQNLPDRPRLSGNHFVERIFEEVIYQALSVPQFVQPVTTDHLSH